MKKNQLFIIFGLLAVSLFLGGCGTLVNPSSWPGVAVEGETVFVAHGSHVYALQLSNGSERWRFPEEAENSKSFYAAPILDGEGNIYIGSYSQSANNGNNIYKISVKDGREIWHFDQANNRYIASPLVVEGAVYAPNSDNRLYKISSDGDWQDDWAFYGEEPLWAQPQWEDGTLFISGMDHHVYAVEAESGELIWVTDDIGSAMAGSPMVGEGDDIYVGTFGSEVIAIDKTSGAISWRASTEYWVWATPVLFDGNLYIGDESGLFLVLDAKTGDELWRLEADGAILGSALVLDGKIYFGTESGKIYRVEVKDGGNWEYAIIYSVEGKAYSPLVAADEMVLVGVVVDKADTILVAIDLDGNEKWTFAPEK